MNGGNSRAADAAFEKFRVGNIQKNESAHAAVGDHAFMQHGDAVGGGALAKPWDHGMQKAGKTRQKKRAGEGKRHALMLEIAFPDGLGMGDEKPRKHDQDPIGHRE